MSGAPARKTVLVVDDEASIRDLVAKALSAKYTVVTAKDGLEASEKLGAMDPPSLVICDVMMPHVDGFSLIRKIKGSTTLQGVPVIFLTAKSTPAAIVQGIQLGAKHFIQKPFSVVDLLAKVQKLLG